MSNNICLPTNHLIIIFMVLIGSAAWYIHNENKKHLDELNYKYNDGIIDNLNKTINELKNNLISDNIEKKMFLTNRDRNVLYNDFAAPERRQQAYAYPHQYVKNKINIPTRGLPDTYHLIGVILRNNTESAFNLFGRQTFPGSNQWEYYVEGVMNDTQVKLPIKIKGDREVEDGQNITVPGTDLSKGDYKVKLYDFDIPRYNPYI